MVAFTRMNANETRGGKRASERERWRPEGGRRYRETNIKKREEEYVCSAVWDQWRVSYFHESRLIYIYCVSRVHCTKSALALSQVCWCSVFDTQRITHRAAAVYTRFWFYASLECVVHFMRVYAMQCNTFHIAIGFLAFSFLLSPSPAVSRLFNLAALITYNNSSRKNVLILKKIKQFLSDKVHQSQLLSVALESIAF